ncbi:glycoside hydrolase domain-containing protein [Amycolatopsis sp. NPDC026612]|uniref:glycoside hydrolase domain-containing protein n=1 Tax=Amycolatopsis sp. NPDC026612 TaxID=3155466 RepID=UPI0033E13B91
MTLTIQPRSAWGQYVSLDSDLYEMANHPPRPSLNPDWSPVMGVFIHHRGPGSADLPDETACRLDIAIVFLAHAQGSDYFGDIAYNWLICPHGNVYTGRGYERGEANYGKGPKIEGYGRNEGFYSICALMRSDNTATVEMLQAYRDLIHHLRFVGDNGSRLTGDRIYPHQYEYPETECPGNLLMYAQPGSTIDPAAPWTGLADIDVFAAQRWVNATYTGVADGYVRCPENGRTGWPTVFSLTQGLQHELGISPTVQNFGPGTFAAVKNRGRLPSVETNENLLRIFNGALWCKGYFASPDQRYWSVRSQSSLIQLYADAGLSYESMSLTMWPHVCRGLLRMDQFRLIPQGDVTIQRVQQRLNSRYVAGVGIPAMILVPCDGVYTRDVQQGFMMGLQYELGLAVSSINGNFGPATQAALKGRGSGRLVGDLRYLFRAACYFNSPTPGPNGQLIYRPDDIGTDDDTASHRGWLRAFQTFCQLPATVTNDYGTWAQLLISTGDAERTVAGCDCVKEITAVRGQALRSAGYQIVGRYLDEDVPADDPRYLGKALKPSEPQTILDAGLRFFPLFQYYGRVLSNFTYAKGLSHGQIATDKAAGYRIPAGSCLYFAVDYDALDVDIDSNIKPYFQGVREGIRQRGDRYRYGVYGSRHVCSRISHEVDAQYSMVAAMSWGYSGNLGFPMPENWSFNQVKEFDFQSGWGLDNNVWRDAGDLGVSSLSG